MSAAAAKSCPTLCDPIDGSPPGSPVPGILQARILEWVAMFNMSLIKLLLAISFQVNLAKTVYKYSQECVKVIERNL